MNSVKEERGSLFVRVDSQLRQVEISRILYVTGLKDYVMIYLEGEARPLITHVTMKAMEEMLSTGRFMRVHRSYIVALDKIRSVDRNNCVYIGKEIIHVTDAYKEAFNAYLLKCFLGAAGCSTFLNLDAHSKLLTMGILTTLQCPL